MSQDHTLDILTRENIFLMGILEPCSMVSKKTSDSNVSTQVQKENSNSDTIAKGIIKILLFQRMWLSQLEIKFY